MGESGPFYLTSVSNGHVLARSPNGQPSGVVVQNRGDQDQPQQWMIEQGEEPDVIALRCLSNDQYLHANGGTNWSTVGTGEKQWWRCSGQDVTAPQACRLSPVDYPNVYLNHFQGIRVAKGQSMKVHMWQWDKNWEFCLTWYICNAGSALQATHQKAHSEAPEEVSEESEGLFGSFRSGTETPTQSKLDSSAERIRELEEQLARQAKELEQQKLALKQELEEKFGIKLKEREEQAKREAEDAQKANQKKEEEERQAKQKLQDEQDARKKQEDEERAKQKIEKEKKAKQKKEDEQRAKQKLEDEKKAKQKEEDDKKAKQKLEDDKKAKQKLEDDKKAKQKQEEEKKAKQKKQQQQQQEGKPKAAKKQSAKPSPSATNITVPAIDAVSNAIKKDPCKHMVLSPPRKIRKKVVGIIYAQDAVTGALTNKEPGTPRSRRTSNGGITKTQNNANDTTHTTYKNGNTVTHTTWTNGTNGTNGFTTRREVNVRS